MANILSSHRASRLLWIVALWLLTPVVAFHNNTQCNISLPMRERLKGQHLNIADLIWEPFAMYDTTSQTWSGFDIEILDNVARTLGFTYSISPMVKDSNESYTNAMVQNLNSDTDFIMGYWLHSPSRRSVLNQMVGLVNQDYLLVTTKAVLVEPRMYERLGTWLAPFDANLWLAIVVAVFVAGGVMYGLEKEYMHETLEDGRKFVGPSLCQVIGMSMYLSAALFVQTGAHEPRSPSGRLFMVFWGLTVLVLLSCYTASMASFLVVGAETSSEINSVDDLINRGLPACIMYEVGAAAMRRIFPDLLISMEGGGPMAMPERLRSKTCAAAIVNRVELRMLQRDPANCHLRVKGGTLLPSTAGWATGLHSTCLSQTLDYALEIENSNGNAELELARWLPPASCGASRRLGQFHEGALNTVHQRSGKDGIRRAITSGSSTSNPQEAEIPQLHLVDMAGLFMMMGCAIVIVGIVKLARRTLCPHVSFKDPENALEAEMVLTMEQQLELLSRKLDGVEAMKELLEAQGQQLEAQGRRLDLLTGQGPAKVAAIRGGLHQAEIRVDNSLPQASSSDGVHVDSDVHEGHGDTIAVKLPNQLPQLLALGQPQQDPTGREGCW